MTPTAPGHYRVMQPYLTGGGQVRLVCRRCWHQFEIEVPRLPVAEKHDTLRGRCLQCNLEQIYVPSPPA